MRDRHRIALQKKGRLTEPSIRLLKKSGLHFDVANDELMCEALNQPYDLLRVRDDDIPALVAEDMADWGIVGRNVYEECEAEAMLTNQTWPLSIVSTLNFGQCRLSFASPKGIACEQPKDIEGLSIATSYPSTVRRWLKEHNICAEVLFLSGSVEIAPKLGKADVIVDLVSTGRTLAANDLIEGMVLMHSQAVLIGRTKDIAQTKQSNSWLTRLDTHLRLEQSKVVVFQTGRTRLAQVLSVVPELTTSSVLRLDEQSDRVAVQAMHKGDITWQKLAAMRNEGASDLMVLSVEQMLA